MPVTFLGGSALPAVGSPAYKAAQQGSGTQYIAPTTNNVTNPGANQALSNSYTYQGKTYNNLSSQQIASLKALDSAPSVKIGGTAAGIVPQVYPGSTGSGTSQNVSTSSYGGYTPQALTAAPSYGAVASAAPAASSGSWWSKIFSNAGNQKANAVGTAPSVESILGIKPTYGTAENPAGTQSNASNPQTEQIGGKTAIVSSQSYNTRPGANAGQSATTSQIPNDKMSATQSEIERLAKEQAERKANAAAQLKAAQDAVSQAEPAQSTDEYKTFNPDINPQVQALNAALAAAEQSYQDSLKDTPEMIAAQEQLDALKAQEAQVGADLGEKTYNVNKEPIPAKFLQGWGTEFSKEANMKLGQISAKRVPLTQQLATAQARRAAALDAAKASVTSAKENRNRAQDIYKTNYQTDQNKKKAVTLSAGQQSYQYNPATGKMELVASAPNRPTASTGTRTTQYGSTNIPSAIKNDLVADISSGGSLDQLYQAYPDVSTSYIAQIYRSLRGQDTSAY